MAAITPIKIRRGTAALWTSTNPILALGEMGFETDTLKIKFGDGTSGWTALAYANVTDLSSKADVVHTHTVSQLSDATTIGKEILLDVTAADVRTTIGAGTSNLVIGTGAGNAKAGNWVPSFSEVTGTIATNQLPPIAINDTFPVASQAAMLALTAQRGDMAIRSDIGETFVLSTDSPSTLADWLIINAAGKVTSVAGRSGAVVLTKSDVGLSNVDNTSDASKPVSTATQTALNLKANLASPTFTGTVTLPSTTNGLTKSNVGLSNVDNTSDANKPVSTATQTALNGKANSSHTHSSADILVIDGGTP